MKICIFMLLRKQTVPLAQFRKTNIINNILFIKYLIKELIQNYFLIFLIK